MSDKIKQLEQTVATLKIRVFDLSEALASAQEQTQSLNNLAQEIVKIVGLNEGDHVTFDAILDKIRSLVDTEETESEVQ